MFFTAAPYLFVTNDMDHNSVWTIPYLEHFIRSGFCDLLNQPDSHTAWTGVFHS